MISFESSALNLKGEPRSKEWTGCVTELAHQRVEIAMMRTSDVHSRNLSMPDGHPPCRIHFEFEISSLAILFDFEFVHLAESPLGRLYVVTKDVCIHLILAIARCHAPFLPFPLFDRRPG